MSASNSKSNENPSVFGRIRDVISSVSQTIVNAIRRILRLLGLAKVEEVNLPKSEADHRSVIDEVPYNRESTYRKIIREMPNEHSPDLDDNLEDSSSKKTISVSATQTTMNKGFFEKIKAFTLFQRSKPEKPSSYAPRPQ